MNHTIFAWRLAWLTRVALLVLGASALGGCGSSSSPSGALFDGPPRLRIDEVRPAGGPTWVPGGTSCLSPGLDPGGTIAVVIGEADAKGVLVNWQLSPPGACIGVAQCGYLALTLERCDPAGGEQCEVRTTVETHLSAGRTITFPIGRSAEGRYRFHVELRSGDGATARNADGDPYEASVVIDVSPHCGADAGPDASDADAGPDASDADAGPDASDAGHPDGAADAAPADSAPPLDAATDAASDGAPASDGSMAEGGAAEGGQPDASRTDASTGDASPATDGATDATVSDAPIG